MGNPHVTLDTIAWDTNLSLFDYKGDTIALENLYVPLGSGSYEETETGEMIKKADTVWLRYGNKRWQLPKEWQTDRLSLSVIFHIKTKNRRYLGLILTDPYLQGETERNSIAAAVDIDSGTAVGYIRDYATSAKRFTDHDSDGILDYRYIYYNKGRKDNYTIKTALCRLQPDGSQYYIFGTPDDIETNSVSTEQELEDLINSLKE